MTFSESVSTCFSKYGSIDGRAPRSEYWWFVLFYFIAEFTAGFIGQITGGEETANVLSVVVALGLILPSITVAARRLHDVDMSGWNQLWPFTIIGIPFYLFWVCSPGTTGPNKYGDPVSQIKTDQT